jgi:hypothetical protein
MNVADSPTDCVSDDQSYLSLATTPPAYYRPMADPLSVYVPFDSLTEETIRSVVKTVKQCAARHSSGSSGSWRPLIAFLIALNEKLAEIKSNPIDEKKVERAEQLQQWMNMENANGKTAELDWTRLNELYEKMKDNDNAIKPYHELSIVRVSDALITVDMDETLVVDDVFRLGASRCGTVA